jgi:ABC-type molybdate transport system substrate-binding protein
MKQMLLVVLLGLLVVLTAYGVNLAYERYVQLKRIESLNTQMSDGVKLAQAGNYREALARFVNVYENARLDDVRAVAGRNAAVCLVHLGDEALQRGAYRPRVAILPNSAGV